MGIKNKLAKLIGHEVVESMSSNDPALFLFLDALNEMTIFEAFALYRDKKKAIYLSQPTSFIQTKEPVDYFNYGIRFTREVFAVVLADLLKELGFTEVMDVSLTELVDAITEVGEDNR